VWKKLLGNCEIYTLFVDTTQKRIRSGPDLKALSPALFFLYGTPQKGVAVYSVYIIDVFINGRGVKAPTKFFKKPFMKDNTKDIKKKNTQITVRDIETQQQTPTSLVDLKKVIADKLSFSNPLRSL